MPKEAGALIDARVRSADIITRTTIVTRYGAIERYETGISKPFACN